jgi:hypothetical protein
MVNRVTVTGTVLGIKQNSDGVSGSYTVVARTIYGVVKAGKKSSAVRDNLLVFNYNSAAKLPSGAANVKKFDHVRVTGHVNSFVRINKNNVPMEVRNLYLDSMEKVTTEFEKTFGVPGGHYPADDISMCAEGTIVGVRVTASNSVELTVNMADKDAKKKNNISFVLFDAMAEEAKKCALGDKVCFSATIRYLDDDERNGRDMYQFRVTGFACAENKAAQTDKTALPSVKTPQQPKKEKTEELASNTQVKANDAAKTEPKAEAKPEPVSEEEEDRRLFERFKRAMREKRQREMAERGSEGQNKEENPAEAKTEVTANAKPQETAPAKAEPEAYEYRYIEPVSTFNR